MEPALSERKPDPLHDEIVDFATLLKGDLAQRFVEPHPPFKPRHSGVRARHSGPIKWPGCAWYQLLSRVQCTPNRGFSAVVVPR